MLFAVLAGAGAPRAAGPAVTDVRVALLSAGSARVDWRAPGAQSSWVEVGHTAPYGVWYSAAAGADGRFSATLTALTPATEYRFRIVARGKSGRSSALGSLTTPAIPPRTDGETRDGRIVLDGQPFFPIMAWGQCPETYSPLIALGLNVFLGACPFHRGPALLRALDGRAYAVLPVAEFGTDGRGLIGFNYPDEPEGFGITAESLSDLPPPSETGRIRFLTLTNHFYSVADPIAPGRGKEIYPAYFAKADALGFDLYPLSKFCGNRWLGLDDDFAAGLELSTVHVPGKPTYQWIETGPLEGECLGSHPVTPETLHAEVWLAIAGGAMGIGYFTHTWKPIGPNEEWIWNRFDVETAVQNAIARENARIQDLAPALLGKVEQADVHLGSPVRAGARSFERAVYIFAVNASLTAVDAAVTVPALRARFVDVLGEGRSVAVRGSTVVDHFEPLAVHLYVALPPDAQAAASGAARPPRPTRQG